MRVEGLDEKYTCTGNYIVAFIDVLGTKAKYYKKKEECLEELWLITHIINKEVHGKDIVFRTFSDNFFIGIECTNDEVKAFNELCNILGNLTYRCLTSGGILFRGAISKGTMHIDENIILGDALIRAYSLESSCAIFPRIIIDKNTISIGNPNSSMKYSGGLYLDIDSFWCINPLKYTNEKMDAAFRNSLKAYMIKNKAECQLNKDLRAKAKVDYYINYVNEYYKEKNGVELIKHSIFEEIESMSENSLKEIINK